MASKKKLRKRIRRQDRTILALTDALDSAAILLEQARATDRMAGSWTLQVPYEPKPGYDTRGE